ncbi:MAG: arsenate reductase ArsC [Bdellovibrionales bacterium]|nr:arsenate reductase ArsC [Bdellovibrionales bacterium]
MINVLFLCTGNSCRSQMAEGWAQYLKDDNFQFFSAGTQKHGLNPHAVEVMKEVGVDISKHQSKTIDELPTQNMDFVITVCSDAHETCPYFPGTGRVIHRGFDDPPRLTQKMTNTTEALNVYRRVRDEIKDFILDLENQLENL